MVLFIFYYLFIYFSPLSCNYTFGKHYKIRYASCSNGSHNTFQWTATSFAFSLGKERTEALFPYWFEHVTHGLNVPCVKKPSVIKRHHRDQSSCQTFMPLDQNSCKMAHIFSVTSGPLWCLSACLLVWYKCLRSSGMWVLQFKTLVILQYVMYPNPENGSITYFPWRKWPVRMQR